MRKTPEQLEQEAREAQAIRQARQDWDATLTEDDADRLGKAVYGSTFTNPELTASLGLTGVDIATQMVHNMNAQKLRQEFKYSPPENIGVTPSGKPVQPVGQQQNDSSIIPDFSRIAENIRASIKKSGISEYGLGDLFSYQQMKNKSVMSRMQLPQDDPDWVNEVDPEGIWRNLEIPTKVNDASEILNMSEAQAVKYMIWNGWQAWNEIPNINQRSMFKDGKEIPGKEGNFDLIRAKFPAVRQMWDFLLQAESEANKPSFMQAATAELGMLKKPISAAFNVPFSFLGWVAPDVIKIPGTASSIGPIPLQVDLTKVGDVARGTVRGAMVGFVSAAQFGKNMLEWKMTTGDYGGTSFTTGIPVFNEESLENFKKLVIEGNIITQIANQALKDPSKIDLGSGFFPEGDLMRRAREAHDAGLPKLSQGQTWTFGQAYLDPFIQEGYIDPDGYIADVFSGIADAVFTVGTDIGAWVDPVQAIMRKFNLTKIAASKIIEGRQADIIRDQWATTRSAKNLPTVISDTIDMTYDPVTQTWRMGGTADAFEVPRFAGMLPAGSQLPEEAERIARELADKAMEGKSLAALDTPPAPVPYVPPSNTLAGYKQSIGIIDDGSGILRMNPMAIDDMPNYADGQRALNKLASFNNAGELWDYFLGKVPIGVAVQIQDYVDAARKAGIDPDIKEVHKLLVDGVRSADPLYAVQTPPGVLKQAINQTGANIARWASGGTRQFGTMPGSTFFSFNDPISSIKDMNYLMVVMKVPKAKRHEMLSMTMKAMVEEGSKARFDLANKWMDTVVGEQLRKNGMPEEMVKVITSWAGWDDGIHRWTMDAIGQGYYLPWLEDGTGEILRSVDFLNNGFIMVGPENLRQVINETTNLWKAFQPFRGNAKMEAALRGDIFKSLEKIQKQFLKPIALGAPLPIRMITKVFMLDEVWRTLINGEFGVNSLKSMTALGHVNYNTHGVVIRSAKEISDRIPILEELGTLKAELADARINGLVKREKEIVSQIAKIEKKYGTEKQIRAEINLFNKRIEEDLPGANRKLAENTRGLGSADRDDPRLMRYERSQITETAFRDSEPDKWVLGTSRDLVRMSESEEYRIVAKVLLGGNRDEILDLPRRFRSGDLREAFDRYRKGLGGKENPLMPLDSDAGVNAFVGTLIADISTRTVMDPTLLGAVATGRIGPVAIKNARIDHLWDATPELKDYVRRELLNNPNAPKAGPFYRTIATAEEETRERFLTKNFSWYRDISQKYARGPLHNQKKWRRIIELMPVMDPDEARKMAAALDKSDAPEYLVDEIKRNVKFAEGTATRKQVEMLGDMHGAESVDNILYNFDKQSYFATKHALLFGFFDAFKEQWSFWLRQMAMQPSLMEKARLVQQGAIGMQVPSWAGGEPGRGFLFKDEDTGQQVVAVPFSRQVYSMLGMNAEERISTRNLSLLGQAVPGFFGIGGMVMDSVIPKTEMFNGIRSAFFPFGDPTAKASIADYFAAPWLQGLAGAALSAFGGTEVGKKFDFVSNLEALVTSEMSDTLKATTINAVLTNIAANSDGLPVTGEQRVKLIEDAENKANALIIFKSLFRIFSPAASMTKYFVETEQENVTAGAVLDDLRKFVDETETYSDAVTKLLEKYGDSAWIFLSGSTKAAPGMQPTKEFAQWFRQNESIVTNYPEVGAYLGPQTGEFDPGAYSSQRSAGYRKPADIKKRQEEALNNLAWTIYNNQKKALINKGAKLGIPYETVVNTPEYKAVMKQKSDEIKKQFPLWSPRATSGEVEGTLVAQLDEISRMVKDKKVLKTVTGQTLEKYWSYRQKMVDKAIAQDPTLINDAWRTSRSSGTALSLRQKLDQMGEYLVQQNSDFSVIWQNVLSREFDPPEAG